MPEIRLPPDKTLRHIHKDRATGTKMQEGVEMMVTDNIKNCEETKLQNGSKTRILNPSDIPNDSILKHRDPSTLGELLLSTDTDTYRTTRENGIIDHDQDTINDDRHDDIEAILELIDDPKTMDTNRTKTVPRDHRKSRHRDDPVIDGDEQQRLEKDVIRKRKKILIQSICDLLKYEEDIHGPPCKFDATTTAAEENWKTLRDHDFDLNKLSNSGEKSVMKFGSEFKSSEQLQTL